MTFRPARSHHLFSRQALRKKWFRRLSRFLGSTGTYLQKFFISAEPYERSVSLEVERSPSRSPRYSICVIHTILSSRARSDGWSARRRGFSDRAPVLLRLGLIRACSPGRAPARGLSACSATENCRSRTAPRVGSRIDRASSDGDGRSRHPDYPGRLEK